MKHKKSGKSIDTINLETLVCETKSKKKSKLNEIQQNLIKDERKYIEKEKQNDSGETKVLTDSFQM